MNWSSSLFFILAELNSLCVPSTSTPTHTYRTCLARFHDKSGNIFSAQIKQELGSLFYFLLFFGFGRKRWNERMCYRKSFCLRIFMCTLLQHNCILRFSTMNVRVFSSINIHILSRIFVTQLFREKNCGYKSDPLNLKLCSVLLMWWIWQWLMNSNFEENFVRK